MLNLENALATVEAEHKELTEENNILRHDTDKAVELQIELDQVWELEDRSVERLCN